MNLLQPKSFSRRLPWRQTTRPLPVHVLPEVRVPFRRNTGSRWMLFMLLIAGCLAWIPLQAANIDCFLKIPRVEGESTVVGYDEIDGVLSIGRNINRSSPEWKYVPVRRYASYFDGRFLTAADLNNDNQDDIILPAYAANKLFVIWGHELGDAEIIPEAFDVGPGPTAVAPSEISGSAPTELLIATIGSPQMEVRGWNFITREPVTGSTRYPSGFAGGGLLGFDTAGSAPGASSPALAILRLDANNEQPVIELFSHNPSPIYSSANSIQSTFLGRTMTELTSGHPLGGGEPGWFMVWSPNSGTVVMVPSSGGSPETYDLGAPILKGRLYHSSHSGGANFLMADGSVRFYSFSPGSGLVFQQQLDPPTGESFFALAGSGEEVVTLSRSRDVPYGNFNFQVHLDSSTGFQLSMEGVWPEPPPANGQTTVALYTGDPFGTTPFLVESFAAGDWAANAQINGGAIDATLETDGGSVAGLGSPSLQNLQPTIAPGAGAATLGNQWEPSSSLFYSGSPVFNGLATVNIQPSPGSHPTSIAVTFQPGPDVTVNYSVNQGGWQSGNGPVWIAGDATVEYYGEHSGGSLSPIHSANYFIDQPDDTDGDGDGIPDLIEALAGSDPTKADTDGDGAGDFAELLDGSDPNDPNSLPSSETGSFDEIVAEFNWDDDPSVALPADHQDLFVSDPANPNQAETKARRIPGLNKVSDVTLKRGIISQQAWFPSDYALEGGGKLVSIGPAMTALVGVLFPPRPVIPLDLEASDPVDAWTQAVQLALDDFHATPLQFDVGPTATMGAVMIEYWYGLQLLSLGQISSIAERPRIADTPRSPFHEGMSAAAIEAIQHPVSGLQSGYDLAQVMQWINESLQTDPSFLTLRNVAETFYAQAIQARQTGEPLESPIAAMRALIEGGTTPDGYSSPVLQISVLLLRDELLNLITPRMQVDYAGTYLPKPGGSELQVGASFHDLLFADGTGWHPAGWEIIQPGSTINVRGFLLPGLPPSGLDGRIEVLEVGVVNVPEAQYADLDGNGLPDVWEQVFLGGVGSPLGGDTDGDGYLDPEELGAGTDPTDPLLIPGDPPATPRDLRIEYAPGFPPQLVWDGSTTVDYEVWVTTGFFEWVPNHTGVQSNGPERHTTTIDGTQPHEFYRVQLLFPWMRP